MTRSGARLFLLCMSAVLLTGFFALPSRADSPALSAVFGIAGLYKPGGWCPVTVTIRNPGPNTISGQLQVLTENDPNRPAYGRPVRNTASVIFARPVTVTGGSSAPQSFQITLRGIDPSQANLTVRLVEGHDRGDGRALAQINTQNSSTSAAFTGGPASPNSHLLVGFGGDPGAFLFLNGLHWTAAKTLSSNPVSSGMPATLQVAEAAKPADLPDAAAGYDGVDSFLLRSDAPVEGLTEAQIGALKGWVLAGGHLIVCGGPDPTRFQSAFFEGLLPAAVSSVSASGTLVLSPKSLLGVHVLSAGPGGAAHVVAGPYGLGSVTLTAFDPTAHAPQSAVPGVGQPGLSPTWLQLLSSGRDQNSSVLAITAAREENYGAVYYGSSPPQLSEAVMRAPSLDAPGTAVIGIFLLVYLLVLVPVNYFVLKKLDRKEWAWGTIPALVFIFAAGTFGVGYAAKGGSVFVNRASIIETSAGQQEAGVYSEVGLFSPHRSTYDLGLSGSNMAVAIPNPGTNYGRGGGSDNQFSGPSQFVETPGGVSVQNASVNMWAMRSFDAQSTTDLGGSITGSLAGSNGQVTGSLVNQTVFTLSDCAVFYAGGWQRVGVFASGTTLAVPGTGRNSAPQAGLPLPAQPVGAHSDIRSRMQAALGEYFRSLGRTNPNYYGNYYGAASSPSYAPASGEALLVGWSDDPKLAGSALRIDGRAVTENDITLVIVHIPMRVK